MNSRSVNHELTVEFAMLSINKCTKTEMDTIQIEKMTQFPKLSNFLEVLDDFIFYLSMEKM